MFWSHTDLREQIRAFGLDTIANIIVHLVKPAIQLSRTLSNDNAIELGISKFGGHPDLPPNTKWPYWKDIPLTFIAQFKLSQIPSIAPNANEFSKLRQLTLWDMNSIPSSQLEFAQEILPNQGMIYFFYDALSHPYADRGGWHIAYAANEHGLKRRSPPIYDGDWGQFKSLPVHELRFARRLSLPFPEDMSRQTLNFFSHDFENRYWQIASANYPKPHHHLYGYPWLIQNSLEFECVFHTQHLQREKVTNTYKYRTTDGRLINLKTEMNKWQFLFQIDTDNSLNVMWGDVGTLYVCIPKASLASQIFEDCWTIMQCS